MTNSNTLEEQLGIVKRMILRRFGNRNSESDSFLDDLIQEASITAWKGYMSGKDSLQICTEARYRALELVSNRQDTWTSTETSHNGAATKKNKEYSTKEGEATRTRIREFISSYMKTHAHPPIVAEIAKALGLAHCSVSLQMKRLHLFTGNTDFTLAPLDEHFNHDENDTHSLINHIRFGYSFETQLVDKIVLVDWMNKFLDDRDKRWIYHYMFEGLSHRQISELYGYSPQLVGQTIRKAFDKIREVADEDFYG